MRACVRLHQVPCLLPFAATFRFSPQKLGGRSDPTNQNVVLLQGRSAIIEVSLESRSPHALELMSLDIEVRAVPQLKQQFQLLVPNARVLRPHAVIFRDAGTVITHRYTLSLPAK